MKTVEEDGLGSASAGHVSGATDRFQLLTLQDGIVDILVGGARGPGASSGRMGWRSSVKPEKTSASTCDTFITSLTNTPLCPPLPRSQTSASAEASTSLGNRT